MEVIIFLLNYFIIRQTKIINRAGKNWAHFYKIKDTENQNFQKFSLVKVGLLVKSNILKRKFFRERFDQLLTEKNDLESQNLEMFDEVAHNFGNSDNAMI